MTTTRTKSLLVGTLSGVLCLLAASQSAFAAPAELDREDIVRSEQRAIQDALEGEARGYRCETVQTQDGSWEAQCGLTESEAETEACGEFAQSYQPANQSMAYEACMTIALHTPGAVR